MLYSFFTLMLLVSTTYINTGINHAGFSENTALLTAIHNDDASQIKSLFSNYTFDTSFIVNTFYNSICLSKIDATNAFIDSGMPINTQLHASLHTPLGIAVINDDKPMVSNLLNNNADPNVADQYGMTALFYARRPDIITLLCEKGAALDHKDICNNSIIHHLSSNNNIENLSTFLTISTRKHPDLINHRNNDYLTALHKSCYYENRPDVVKLLIKHGARVNHITKYHNAPVTPFILSLVKGNFGNSHELLKAGAYIKPSPNNPLNPLILKMKSGKFDVALTHTILNVIDDIDAHQCNHPNGDTAVTAATKSNNAAGLNFLLKHGADSEKKVNGKKPLFWAISSGSVQTAAQLMVAGSKLCDAELEDLGIC